MERSNEGIPFDGEVPMWAKDLDWGVAVMTWSYPQSGHYSHVPFHRLRLEGQLQAWPLHLPFRRFFNRP